MATLDELLVRIDASTELLRRELAKGTGEVSKFEQKTSGSLDKIDKRFSLLGRGIKTALAAFGVAFSVRGIANFARAAITTADALVEATEAARTTAETLQELRFAFGQLAGTTDGQVDKALQDFNKNLGLTIQGTGRAKAQFESLGIVLTSSGGAARNTGIVLEETLAALAAIESDAVRAATAARLFGDEAGPKLAAALGQGLSAMEALRAATPGVISDVNVQLASQLNDKFDEMARTVGGGLKNAFISATTAAADFFGIIERGPALEALIRLNTLEQQLASAESFLARNPGFASTSANQAGMADLRARTAEARRTLQMEQARAAGTGGFATRSFLTEAAQRAERDRLLSPHFLRNLGSAQNVPLNQAENPVLGSHFLRNLGSAQNVNLGTGMEDFFGRLRSATNVPMESEYSEFLERVEAKNRETLGNVESQWGDFAATVSSTLHSTLSNAFLGIGTDFKTLIKTMLADLAATGLLRALGTTIGGPAGAFLTGGLPGRASGGPVTAGHGYVVGEDRPEVFVPNMSGKILPSTGGGGTVIYQTLRFDVGLESVDSRIAAAAQLIARATEAKIQESRARHR